MKAEDAERHYVENEHGCVIPGRQEGRTQKDKGNKGRQANNNIFCVETKNAKRLGIASAYEQSQAVQPLHGHPVYRRAGFARREQQWTGTHIMKYNIKSVQLVRRALVGRNCMLFAIVWRDVCKKRSIQRQQFFGLIIYQKCAYWDMRTCMSTGRLAPTLFHTKVVK